MLDVLDVLETNFNIVLTNFNFLFPNYSIKLKRKLLTQHSLHIRSSRVGSLTGIRQRPLKIRDESHERVETKPVINGDSETREGLLMTAGQGETPHLATGSLGTDLDAPATHRPG